MNDRKFISCVVLISFGIQMVAPRSLSASTDGYLTSAELQIAQASGYVPTSSSNGAGDIAFTTLSSENNHVSVTISSETLLRLAQDTPASTTPIEEPVVKAPFISAIPDPAPAPAGSIGPAQEAQQQNPVTEFLSDVLPIITYGNPVDGLSYGWNLLTGNYKVATDENGDSSVVDASGKPQVLDGVNAMLFGTGATVVHAITGDPTAAAFADVMASQSITTVLSEKIQDISTNPDGTRNWEGTALSIPLQAVKSVYGAVQFPFAVIDKVATAYRDGWNEGLANGDPLDGYVKSQVYSNQAIGGEILNLASFLVDVGYTGPRNFIDNVTGGDGKVLDANWFGDGVANAPYIKELGLGKYVNPADPNDHPNIDFTIGNGLVIYACKGLSKKGEPETSIREGAKGTDKELAPTEKAKDPAEIGTEGPTVEALKERVVTNTQDVSVQAVRNRFIDEYGQYLKDIDRSESSRQAWQSSLLKKQTMAEVYDDLQDIAYDEMREAEYPEYEGTNPEIELVTGKDLVIDGETMVRSAPQGSWHYRIPRSGESAIGNTQVRISINAIPGDGVVANLDKFFVENNIEGYYKTPNDYYDWQWRHDPITLYLKEKPTDAQMQELLDRTEPFIRSQEDVLIGEKIAPGVAFDIEPTEQMVRDLEQEARAVDPALGDAIRDRFFYNNELRRNQLSAGRYAAAELMVEVAKGKVSGIEAARDPIATLRAGSEE